VPYEYLSEDQIRHCCIKAKGVLAMPHSGEAGPSDTLENRNKPGILRPAAWLQGEQVDQLGWADRLMQQCRMEHDGLPRPAPLRPRPGAESTDSHHWGRDLGPPRPPRRVRTPGHRHAPTPYTRYEESL
jgi:hypothetical protein